MPACVALSAALSLCDRACFVRQNDRARRPVATASENTGVLA